MRKKNPTTSQVDLDRMFKERMKQFQEQRTAKVTAHDKKTYISFAVHDFVTETSAKEITKLLDLMRVKYQVFTKYISANEPENGNDNTEDAITIEIEADDSAIAEYIQRFIDNNYTLTWKQTTTIETNKSLQNT